MVVGVGVVEEPVVAAVVVGKGILKVLRADELPVAEPVEEPVEIVMVIGGAWALPLQRLL